MVFPVRSQKVRSLTARSRHFFFFEKKMLLQTVKTENSTFGLSRSQYSGTNLNWHHQRVHSRFVGKQFLFSRTGHLFLFFCHSGFPDDEVTDEMHASFLVRAPEREQKCSPVHWAPKLEIRGAAKASFSHALLSRSDHNHIDLMVLHERVPSCIDLNFDPDPWNCSAFSEVHVAVRRVDSSCSIRLLVSDTMQVACVLYYLFFAGRRCLEKKVQKLRHVCACPCMSTGKTNELVLYPCHVNGQTMSY